MKDFEKLVLPPEEWEISFEDNFSFLDKSKWKINTADETGIRRACYYTDDEDIIFVKDNKLYIRTKFKEGKYGKGWYSGFLETSEQVHKNYNTEGFKGFSQTEGYFECRCRVPRSYGIWSAFWLMPDNEIAFSPDDIQFTGEDGIEIDVMESPHYYRRSERLRNQNLNVIHADGYDSRLKSMASPPYFMENMYEEFHTYGFMWNHDSYAFYTDGIKTWETKHIIEGKDFGICRVPEYLILSTEVAGQIKDGKIHEGKVFNSETGEWENYWCGNPGRNDKSKNYDFIIDYVKCYRRKDR